MNNKQGEGLSSLSYFNPLSNQFDLGIGDKAQDIVLYILARQKKRFNQTILDTTRITQRQLLRNTKLLLDIYPIDTVKRAACFASQVSQHPFSTKLIRDLIPGVVEGCQDL